MKFPGNARTSLAFGLGLTALVASGCDEDLLNPMAARQPKVGAYGPSDFYTDGMSMRQPPPGTVPRQRLTGNPGLTSGREGTNLVTTIPIKVDDALMRLGQKRYNITCGTCHGPLGDGDSIVARQMSLKPPPSLMLFADRPAGYIFEVATQGHGLMAAYAAEMTVKERWAVVAYVKALQRAATATLAEAPAADRARLEKETP
ncbi:MAG TPA: cytochrome c [Polyangia bacterium]